MSEVTQQKMPRVPVQKRGEFTEAVEVISRQTLGYAITLRELRLMPYIQYTMMNDQKLNPAHINQEERDILKSWREKGFIEGGASGLSITKDFWDAINQILWVGYVDIDWSN